MVFVKHFDAKKSSLTKISLPGLPEVNNLYMKRDDLVHPRVSGNKWRKLKYNLIEAEKQRHDTILTFGGAFSNHIYAVAAAGKLFGFRTIGVIRGEEHLPLNPTLFFAASEGMELVYLNRTDYREKYHSGYIEKLEEKYGKFYLVPEGGSNVLGVKGASELVDEIDIDFDYICCACGTGGTGAGVVSGLKNRKKFVGISVLKGGGFLKEDIAELVKKYTGAAYNNFEVKTGYHFGGYAKIRPELILFMDQFEKLNNIKLDPVYTGKMMYGIADLFKKKYFDPMCRVIAVHTGGLQGIAGMQEKINRIREEN